MKLDSSLPSTSGIETNGRHAAPWVQRTRLSPTERGQRTGGLSSRDCADGSLSPSWMARREQLTSLATKVNLNAQLRRLADAFQR